MRAVPANLLSDLSKIHTVFKDLDTDKLSPVFEHFKGKYLYDELQLARMMME